MTALEDQKQRKEILLQVEIEKLNQKLQKQNDKKQTLMQQISGLERELNTEKTVGSQMEMQTRKLEEDLGMA